MRVGLLGELEVLDEAGRPVAVQGAKLRALLALLALQPGRPVATDHLVDALWGEDPPAGVRNSLQGLVSKLRRAIGSTDIVAMRGGGYSLDVVPEAVDVEVFESLVEAASDVRASDPAKAAALLKESEAMWRGDPLAEFAYDDWASAHIARLSELRLAALEERLGLDLAAGSHFDVVVELEAVVHEHPLRERARALLMLSLYRAGRQADALRVYQQGREILGEELGLEPGPELRQLETAILSHDPSLDAPAGTAPPPAAAPAARFVIPQPLTPLVGRDQELAQLRELLSSHRLVTLVGPGGVGKTRLALAAGAVASADLDFGGCLVELAPVGDAAGLRASIASALELPDPTRIAELIGERDLLLVLDNCEHLIATAAEVADDLLRRCASLRVLATSREALRVGGEAIWAVPPLATDDAVELFVARATHAGARLDLPSALPAIAEVCDRLDGLPLAIELAAARTRAFPIAAIAARLSDRFRLLTGGSRTALPRQQTLRAVVDWSYDLLFDDERLVFERLSVLPGGCDMATAEVVCADEALSPADVGDIVLALVEKSLVVATPTASDVRFTQLQTLAHYAREKLTDRGDASRTRDVMAAHFATLCRQSTAAFSGDNQRAWLAAMDAEQDNLRAALEWAVANDDAETALAIAGGASWPHWLAGRLVEAKRWLDLAMSCAGDASEITAAVAAMGRALIDFQSGVREGVDAGLELALAVFRRNHDVAATLQAYSFYAEVAIASGRRDEARRRVTEALEFYAGLPRDVLVAGAMAYSHAKLALLDGDLAEAERHYRAAAASFGEIDRPVMRSMSMGMVADFDERAGDFDAAVTALEEAVATNDELGLRGYMGALLARLGWVLLHVGDVPRAEAMYRRGLELARRLDHRPAMFLGLAGVAVVAHMSGNDAESAAAAAEALDIHVENAPARFGNRVDPQRDVLTGVAACCSALAAIAAAADRPEQAATLLGHAQQIKDTLGVTLPRFLEDESVTTRQVASGALGADGFALAFDRGRSGRLGVDVDYRVEASTSAG